MSGYVSIATGRTRGTEDIDVLVPLMSRDRFRQMFQDLQRAGFWCHQGDTPDKVFEYLQEGVSVRFAILDQMFPNAELIPVTEKRKTQRYELQHPQLMRIDDWTFKAAPIEFEILYTEKVLCGEKDLKDARHLRDFFKDILDAERFDEYSRII
ncbi:MAG: hypothetical protein ABH879_00790 [archaeon]